MTRMESTRRNPLDEMRHLMDMFDRGWPRLEGWLKETSLDNLPIDVYDENGDIVVKAAMPGMGKEDVEITVTDDILTIKGESKEEREVDEKDYYLHELHTGVVQRSIRLPADVDASKADAKFDNGSLVLHIPRKAKAKTRHIKVGVA